MKEGKKESYVIAWSGPLSNPSLKHAAQLQKQGVEFFIEHVNRQGGIKGRTLKLRVFDDAADKKRAVEIAREIGESDDILAVIGHSGSSISLAAAPIYKEYKIPVISISSTNDKLTIDNPWSFRSVFNDSFQGRFLANYIKSVLELKNVTVIYETADFGKKLAETFIDAAKQSKLNVYGQLMVDFENEDGAEKQIKKLAAEISGLSAKDSIIFFSGAAKFAHQTIQILREEGIEHRIIGPDAIATTEFSDRFRSTRSGERDTMSYVNGVLAASPLLLDSVGQQAQNMASAFQKRFDHEPNWQSFFSYDATLLLTEGLRSEDISGKKESIQSDRRKIRDFLASINNPQVGISGVTGILYFDKEGNGQKPLVIGEFVNGTLITSSQQLRPTGDIKQIPDIERMKRDRDVISFLGEQYYRTRMVYTGIRFNSISELDLVNSTAKVNFDLWFRFAGKENITDIGFINSIGKTTLPKPVQSYNLKGIQYRHYRIEEKFKLDFGSRNPKFGSHQVGISFKHQFFNHNLLTFVTDLQGVGATTGPIMVQSLIQDQVLPDESGWHISDVAFISQPMGQDTLGNPYHLGGEEGYTQSLFNAIVEISPNELTVRRKILFDNMDNSIMLLSALFCILVFISTKKAQNKFAGLLIVSQAIIGLFLLLVIESYLLEYLPRQESTSHHALKQLVLLFDIFWWIVPALYLHRGVHLFVWSPLEQRTGRIIPGVAKGTVSTVILLMTIFGIVGFVFARPITSLLATSGMVAMIIGLAIQMNISNIFSGLAINMERPFRTGDIVKIGNNP
ncbi:MAG: ABC transporter substrate-binding protein, partial [Magnetococcales bacterium]|nr:ABC transporter substrate-binding protein [Magnetococcales bacterium]